MNVNVVATVDEFARLLDLLAEYESSLRPDLRHDEFERERSRLSEVYAPPNAAFVAEIDGDACGCVVFVRLDASTAVVKRLYVRDAFRGRGVARALMAATNETARSLGYTRLVLDTQRDELPAAYRLYLTLGFRECEAYADVPYAAPTFMELTL